MEVYCTMIKLVGCFYETIVKMMKRTLKRALGNKNVNKIELETCLYEVEACVKSRPLCPQNHLILRC